MIMIIFWRKIRHRLSHCLHEIHKRSDLDEVDSIVEDSIREVCINMHIHNLCAKVAHSL